MAQQSALPMPATLEHLTPVAIKIERDRLWMRQMLVGHLDTPREAAAIERWARSLTTTNCSVTEYEIAQVVLAILDARKRGRR